MDTESPPNSPGPNDAPPQAGEIKYALFLEPNTRWDIVFAGEMHELMGDIRLRGYFMNPQLYVRHEKINFVVRILDEPSQDGQSADVVTLRPVQ